MPRALKITLGLLVGGAIAAICSYAAVVIVLESRMVYATPELKSAFLTTYDPKTVLKPFMSPRWTSDWGEGDGNVAGEGRATFTRNFEVHFAMRPEDQPALMTALSQSIVGRLTASGARITREGGTRDDKYQFVYTVGRSTGTIVLRPVKQLDDDDLKGIAKNSIDWRKESFLSASPDEVPVEVAMSIKETWTK